MATDSESAKQTSSETPPKPTLARRLRDSLWWIFLTFIGALIAFHADELAGWAWSGIRPPVASPVEQLDKEIRDASASGLEVAHKSQVDLRGGGPPSFILLLRSRRDFGGPAELRIYDVHGESLAEPWRFRAKRETLDRHYKPPALPLEIRAVKDIDQDGASDLIIAAAGVYEWNVEFPLFVLARPVGGYEVFSPTDPQAFAKHDEFDGRVIHRAHRITEFYGGVRLPKTGEEHEALVRNLSRRLHSLSTSVGTVKARAPGAFVIQRRKGSWFMAAGYIYGWKTRPFRTLVVAYVYEIATDHQGLATIRCAHDIRLGVRPRRFETDVEAMRASLGKVTQREARRCGG
jgi:hypothetical protein